MFEFLKSLFTVRKGLGAKLNPPDVRDIQLVSFQKPVGVPYKYKTDISMLPVMDQKSYGTCVGQAEGLILAYFDYLENKKFDVSRRYLYAKSKKEDGFDGQGTYPRVMAGIISKTGATTSKFVADNNDLPYNEYLVVSDTEDLLNDAIMRKANYAFVAPDSASIKAALISNKLVSITLPVDWNAWRTYHLKAPKKIDGYHRIVIFGFEGDTFFFRNSWSEKWGDKGNGEFFSGDYNGLVNDALVYVDIPNDILEKAKNTPFQFTEVMRFGSRGLQVKELQKKLGIYADGVFGNGTKTALIKFQIARGLKGDGIAGPQTLFELNRKVSKLDLWAEAIKDHEGWYPASRSYRNNNPGNLKYVGQKRATGKDSGGFCIFRTYADGFQELRDLLVRAATDPDSTTYRANMTLLEFFHKYAPSSDGNAPEVYAKAVARKIGVSVGVPISSLIS